MPVTNVGEEEMDDLPEIRFRSRSQRMEEKRWKHKLYHRSKSKHITVEENNNKETTAREPRVPPIPDLYTVLPDLYSEARTKPYSKKRRPTRLSNETLKSRSNAILGELFSVYADENCKVIEPMKKSKSHDKELKSVRFRELEQHSEYRKIPKNSLGKKCSDSVHKKPCYKIDDKSVRQKMKRDDLRDCKVMLERLDLKAVNIQQSKANTKEAEMVKQGTNRHFSDALSDVDEIFANAESVAEELSKYDESESGNSVLAEQVDSGGSDSGNPNYVYDDAYSDISMDEVLENNLECVYEDFSLAISESYCTMRKSDSYDGYTDESARSPDNYSVDCREESSEKPDYIEKSEIQKHQQIIPVLERYQNVIGGYTKSDVKDFTLIVKSECEENSSSTILGTEENSNSDLYRWNRERCLSVDTSSVVDCDTSVENPKDSDDSTELVCDSVDNQNTCIIQSRFQSLNSPSSSSNFSHIQEPLSVEIHVCHSPSFEISSISNDKCVSTLSPLHVNTSYSPSMPCLSSVESVSSIPSVECMPILVSECNGSIKKLSPDIQENSLDALSDIEENSLSCLSTLEEGVEKLPFDCTSKNEIGQVIASNQSTTESLQSPSPEVVLECHQSLRSDLSVSPMKPKAVSPSWKRRKVRCKNIKCTQPAEIAMGSKEITAVVTRQSNSQPCPKRTKLSHRDVGTQLRRHVFGFLQVHELQIGLPELPQVYKNMILCCEEEGLLDLNCSLKLIEQFSQEYVVPTDILMLVIESAFINKDAKLKHIHSTFKTLSEINGRQPGQIQVQWQLIENCLTTVFVEEESSSKQVLQASLLLKLLTSALQLELYSCDLLDNGEVRRSRAFSMLAYDMSTPNRKSLVSYIGPAVWSRASPSGQSVLTTLQDLLSLSVDVSSSCEACAGSLAQNLKAVYKGLSDVASRRSFLTSFTSDLLLYRVVQVILESSYRGTHPVNGIPDSLQQVLQSYFKAVPLVRRSPTKSPDDKSAQSNAVEETAMLLYFLVKSFQHLSKARLYLPLRKRVLSTSHEPVAWDGNEFMLLGEHVTRLEEHLRGVCTDLSADTHHYLLHLSMLGEMETPTGE